MELDFICRGKDKYEIIVLIAPKTRSEIAYVSKSKVLREFPEIFKNYSFETFAVDIPDLLIEDWKEDYFVME